MKRFLFGVLVGILVCIAVIAAGAFWASRPPRVPSDAVLVIRMSGPIPEHPPVELGVPFARPATTLSVAGYWDVLRKASADSRIRAIVLMPQGVSAGWGKLEELRQDLARFRKSGKPLVALLRTPSTRDYYLATAADRIYMIPEDFLNMKGLRAELMYVKGTLDKLGVRVDVEHAGRYKDAPDMFTRTGMSPETREVVNSVLDTVYAQLTSVIGAARRKTPSQVREIIDQGPFTSQRALAAGLVDALRYQDQVFGEVNRRLKVDRLDKMSSEDYAQTSAGAAGLVTKAQVAFVVAEGDIVRGGGLNVPGNDFVGSAGFNRLLRRVARDNSVQGVIVRVNSPGGDAFASDEILREMRLLSRKKPVVISFSDDAASGGYYMAMTGDPIVAYPGTYTGSIGVFFGKVDLKGLYNKLGIEKQILSRGQFADIDSDYVPLSDVARKKLQAGVDSSYGSFLQKVVEGRKRPLEKVSPLAEGRVWLGTQAKDNGLVDELGGIDRALELLRRRAKIAANDQVELVIYPERVSLWDRFLGTQRDALADIPVLSSLRRYRTEAWLRGGFFQLMPYSIDVQ